MLRLHVVHFLNQDIRHLAGLEDGVGQASLTTIGDRLMVDDVLDWELFKEFPDTLFLGCGLEVCLLELMLLCFE